MLFILEFFDRAIILFRCNNYIIVYLRLSSFLFSIYDYNILTHVKNKYVNLRLRGIMKRPFCDLEIKLIGSFDLTRHLKVGASIFETKNCMKGIFLQLSLNLKTNRDY